MPTAHVRLKPIEWFQEIRHYPQQGGEGRYLGATCAYSDDSNVRLSTGAKLSEFLADLSIMDEEPQYADGRPLEHGIGLLVFKHDRPEVAAYTQGWFPLRGKELRCGVGSGAPWSLCSVQHRYMVKSACVRAAQSCLECRSSRNHHGSIGSVCTHTTITRANPTTSSKGTIQPSLGTAFPAHHASGSVFSRSRRTRN